MILYTNGCSMTYGAELVDSDKQLIPKYIKYREEHSWPGQLGKLIGANEVINDGFGGASNDRITRTSLHYLSKLTPTEAKNHIVVIGWTNPVRDEFPVYRLDGVMEHALYYPSINYKHLKHTLFGKTIDMLRLYEKHFVDQAAANRRTVHNMVGLQNFLKQINVPYVFFNALNLNLSEISEKSLIDKTKYVEFDTITHNMYRWIRDRNFKLKPKGHPDEFGHAAWASYIRSKMILMGII